MRTAAFHTLGCKVNAYETEAMQELLEKAGYTIVPFDEPADVYIVNTCSVTNVADKKSRQMLHRAKAKNPAALVVAAGCYVQAAGEKLMEDVSIDLIIGNNKKADLAAILEEHFAGREARESLIDISAANEYEPLRIEKESDHTRAFVKIQDGCNQFCSYCIIPYTRGRVRSRAPKSVVDEVQTLAKSGYQEIVLTGIHLSSYGVDFSDGPDLLGLIRTLHGIRGIERIRLGSLEPRVITKDFVRALASMPKICPHFHLSLQSGCDATLLRMNRHYTCADYLERLSLLRSCFKNPAVTTDVIVGFPGETEEEFAETKTFLRKAGFFEMHVFKYSRRAGTRADRMPDQIPEAVKAERSGELLALAAEMSKEYCRASLGSAASVLFEEETELFGRPYMLGHTKEYIKTALPLTGNGRKADALKNRIFPAILNNFLTDDIIGLQKLEK
ncbi:MAG: tRNA (N(6)-L-threonylcarbamoyladenosine(37)-C(2))-methylthiotransferase MtaB [Lachnospiraceae bacterium]|nr:tRNA (N(6)-L-threonylcarbamoyladenosine(37)-C(2))-methylthiotransferase MtaB [Lachnospiraceae bacterium]